MALQSQTQCPVNLHNAQILQSQSQMQCPVDLMMNLQSQMRWQSLNMQMKDKRSGMLIINGRMSLMRNSLTCMLSLILAMDKNQMKKQMNIRIDIATHAQ